MKCIKCGCKHDNMFVQWVTGLEDIECEICEECIRENKEYTTDTCYSPQMDMTFIFVEAHVRVNANTTVLLSQTLIGYVYGEPDAGDYIKYALDKWLKNQGNDRLDLLRQSYNENHRDEEVLY